MVNEELVGSGFKKIYIPKLIFCSFLLKKELKNRQGKFKKKIA